jgi:YHS domain-containing protein
MLRYILLLLLLVFIARAFWRVVEGVLEGASGQPRSRSPRQTRVQMARDPVCGTFVVPERAVTIVEGRQQIHFCSASCRDKYRARTA